MKSEMERLERCPAKGMSWYEFWLIGRGGLIGSQRICLFLLSCFTSFLLLDFVSLFRLFCLKTAGLLFDMIIERL